MNVSEEMPAGSDWRNVAFDAIRSDNFDLFVSVLGKGVSVNETDEKGDSLLKLACEKGALSIARSLLERGADTERRDRRDRSALAVAACGGNVKLVRLLVGYGADVTADQGNGRLPVDFAAMSGHPEIVRYLESVSRSGKAGRLVLCRLVRAFRVLAGCFQAKSFYFVPGN